MEQFSEHNQRPDFRLLPDFRWYHRIHKASRRCFSPFQPKSGWTSSGCLWSMLIHCSILTTISYPHRKYNGSKQWLRQDEVCKRKGTFSLVFLDSPIKKVVGFVDTFLSLPFQECGWMWRMEAIFTPDMAKGQQWSMFSGQKRHPTCEFFSLPDNYAAIIQHKEEEEGA